jgi:hypothetical protein
MSTFENLALADCDNLSVNGLFGGRIGDCDAARGGAILFQALHDDTVMKGTNLHSWTLLWIKSAMLVVMNGVRISRFQGRMSEIPGSKGAVLLKRPLISLQLR